MPWFVSILIALVLEVVAYLIMPKPHSDTQNQQIQTPTADASRPIPVVFGTKWVKGTNVLWFGDVSTRTYTVSA